MAKAKDEPNQQNASELSSTPKSDGGSQSHGEQAGQPTPPPVDDHIDESAATYIYPADIGHTVTSHGDGTPSLSPDYVVAREEEAERNADPDAQNKEIARELGLDVD